MFPIKMNESERKFVLAFRFLVLLYNFLVHQMTPLHVAAERGRSHVVKFLAENRASVNIKNCKGVCFSCMWLYHLKSTIESW